MIITQSSISLHNPTQVYVTVLMPSQDTDPWINIPVTTLNHVLGNGHSIHSRQLTLLQHRYCTCLAKWLENGKIEWELTGEVLETETCNWEINTSYDNYGSSIRKGGGWTELSVDLGKSSVKFNIPWKVTFFSVYQARQLEAVKTKPITDASTTRIGAFRRTSHVF